MPSRARSSRRAAAASREAPSASVARTRVVASTRVDARRRACLDAVDASVSARQSTRRHYDSMLTKVTASALTYESAIDKLTRSLRETRIRGVKTNIGFTLNVLKHPSSARAERPRPSSKIIRSCSSSRRAGIERRSYSCTWPSSLSTVGRLWVLRVL